MNLLAALLRTCENHMRLIGSREILKYLGPGILVTVGFIDPGNWAANIAAGSEFGYALLWVVTLSTIMLVLLQHNAAHLGIATGDCLAESASRHLKPWASRLILATAVGAAVATALAEILGAATLADEARFFSHRRRTLAGGGPIGHQISIVRTADPGRATACPT